MSDCGYFSFNFSQWTDNLDVPSTVKEIRQILPEGLSDLKIVLKVDNML